VRRKRIPRTAARYTGGRPSLRGWGSDVWESVTPEVGLNRGSVVLASTRTDVRRPRDEGAALSREQTRRVPQPRGGEAPTLLLSSTVWLQMVHKTRNGVTTTA